MERQIIDIGELAFVLINAPLCFFNIAVNIFFACCLLFPLGSRQRIKQPLKTLLGHIVCCSILYFAFLASFYITSKAHQSFEIIVGMLIILVYFAQNSMTCYVWLNVFYYIHIVPVHQALLIWIKRNIRSVIYLVLIFERMLFLLRCVYSVVGLLISSQGNYNNGTMNGKGILEFSRSSLLITIYIYLLICLSIMMMSSFSTVRYLLRHIKTMTEAGSHFTTPTMQSQMRVTITGILQAVLYILYYVFDIVDFMTYMFSPHFSLSGWVSFTVISLYISGTTVNLSIGQMVFRQKAANVWKALKALSSVGMVTHDVKQHHNQQTQGE